MNKRRVVITGLGVVAPNGVGKRGSGDSNIMMEKFNLLINNGRELDKG